MEILPFFIHCDCLANYLELCFASSQHEPNLGAQVTTSNSPFLLLVKRMPATERGEVNDQTVTLLLNEQNYLL